MATVRGAPGTVPDSSTPDRQLKHNAIGLVAAATLGIVFMSPAYAFYGNWGPVAGTVGIQTVAVFWIAALVILPTALSYAFVARKLTSAGSAYAWIGRLTNRHIGNWLGWILLTFYGLVLVAVPALFGLFFNAFLNDIGIHVDPTNPWTYSLGVVIVFGVASLFAFPGIRSSTRAATLIVGFEILVIVALATTILVKHTGSLSLQPFNPTGNAITSSFWVVLPIAFYSFTGFDVVATAAEETKLARRSIPLATLAAVGIFTLFMIYTVYSFTFAVPVDQIANLVTSGITPVTPIAQQYWGGGGVLISITGLTAGTGALLAVLIGTSRVMFAMGRDRALFAAAGRLHPRFQTPWTAMIALIVVGLVYDLAVGQWIGALNAYFWAGTATAFFALVTYTFVNIGNFLLYFRKPDFNIVWNALVPLAGIVLSIWVLWVSFVQALWNAGWVTIGRGIVVFAFGWAAVGLVYAFIVRNRARPPRVEGLAADADLSATSALDGLAGHAS
ncbi:MAG: amino acid permease [Candidatus Dormibacteraeota bacterium]|uniref:Amino acid permease n=1 Tax=Candidatus Aeolococcus gillhamiae TaxID=3127015 RepID=A0A934JVH1_9BACT|nr:amino acid permease [Candidatus Dormibacteraeota bacterium]